MLNSRRKRILVFFISLSWFVLVFTFPLKAGADVKLLTQV